MRLPLKIEDIERSLVDHRTKGIPGGTAPFPLDEIGERQWNVLREDLPLPWQYSRNRPWSTTVSGCAVSSVSPEL